jgi:hypothetical protein
MCASHLCHGSVCSVPLLLSVLNARLQMGTSGGRPRNEDQGAELRDSLKALNRIRSRDVQDGKFNVLEAQDTRGPASQTWTTRQSKKLEDTLFSIGGLSITMDALEGFLHRPAVRRIVEAIDTGQASLQERLITNASAFLTELLAATEKAQDLHRWCPRAVRL